MKITKSELRQVIKEELNISLDEDYVNEGFMEEKIIPAVAKALQNPEIQKMLMDMIGKFLQSQTAGAPPAGAPAAE